MARANQILKILDQFEPVGPLIPGTTRRIGSRYKIKLQFEPQEMKLQIKNAHEKFIGIPSI